MKTTHYCLLASLLILLYACKSNHANDLDDTAQEGELLYKLDRAYDAGQQLWNKVHDTRDSANYRYAYLLTYIVGGDGCFTFVDTTCTYSLLTGVVDSASGQITEQSHKAQPLSIDELKLLTMHLRANTAFRGQKQIAEGVTYRILAYDHPKFGRKAYIYPVGDPSLLLWGPDCSIAFGDTMEVSKMEIIHEWGTDRTDANKDPHHIHNKHQDFQASDYFRLRAVQNIVPWKQYRIVCGNTRQSWMIDMQHMEITPNINPH